MKTIISLIKNIIFYLIVTILLFSGFTLFTSKTGYLKGLRSFVVISGSMQPSIKVGSIVYTSINSTYSVGDIIAFNNKANQTVTHRIIEKVNKPDVVFYKTQGDANNSPDGELISQKDVIGKVTFTLPFLGRLVQFLKTPAGFLSLIIIPSFIFIIWEFWNIKKELEIQIEKKYISGYYRIKVS